MRTWRPFQREIAAELGVSRRTVRYQLERLTKPGRMYRCGACGELGHNKRTCPGGVPITCRKQMYDFVEYLGAPANDNDVEWGREKYAAALLDWFGKRT